MSISKEIIEKEVSKIKPEIKAGMYKVVEDALITINMNIPEFSAEREAAKEIYKQMQDVMVMLKKDINKGKFDDCC